MGKAHQDDFIGCEPWGAIGDRQNDGHFRSERLNLLWRGSVTHEGRPQAVAD